MTRKRGRIASANRPRASVMHLLGLSFDGRHCTSELLCHFRHSQSDKDDGPLKPQPKSGVRFDLWFSGSSESASVQKAVIHSLFSFEAQRGGPVGARLRATSREKQ